MSLIIDTLMENYRVKTTMKEGDGDRIPRLCCLPIFGALDSPRSDISLVFEGKLLELQYQKGTRGFTNFMEQFGVQKDAFASFPGYLKKIFFSSISTKSEAEGFSESSR